MASAERRWTSSSRASSRRSHCQPCECAPTATATYSAASAATCRAKARPNCLGGFSGLAGGGRSPTKASSATSIAAVSAEYVSLCSSCCCEARSMAASATPAFHRAISSVSVAFAGLNSSSRASAPSSSSSSKRSRVAAAAASRSTPRSRARCSVSAEAWANLCAMSSSSRRRARALARARPKSRAVTARSAGESEASRESATIAATFRLLRAARSRDRGGFVADLGARSREFSTGHRDRRSCARRAATRSPAVLRCLESRRSRSQGVECVTTSRSMTAACASSPRTRCAATRSP
mmetsp:Transcript_18174/g.57085  ORF Transcript_18174/g.57085 Transcript_18174/m.57085 type:complete len:295 (+) Transcript_18174:122-1006(+)